MMTVEIILMKNSGVLTMTETHGRSAHGVLTMDGKIVQTVRMKPWAHSMIFTLI